MDGSLKDATWKEPDERTHTVWFRWYKILENANESIVTEGPWVVAWEEGRGWAHGEGREGWIVQQQEETVGVMELCTSMTAGMAPRV